MKKLFPLLLTLCLFGLVACDSEDKEDEIQETYNLKSITYSMEEGDGKTAELVSLSSRTMFNITDETMQWSFDPMDGAPSLTSHFISNDKNAFALLSGDSVFVPTPYYNTDVEATLPQKRGGHFSEGLSTKSGSVSSNVEARGMLLGSNACYSVDLQELPSISMHMLHITTLPNKKTIVESDAKKTEFRVTYTAVLLGETSGKEITVKGKWVGTQMSNLNAVIKEEDI